MFFNSNHSRQIKFRRFLKLWELILKPPHQLVGSNGNCILRGQFSRNGICSISRLMSRPAWLLRWSRISLYDNELVIAWLIHCPSCEQFGTVGAWHSNCLAGVYCRRVFLNFILLLQQGDRRWKLFYKTNTHYERRVRSAFVGISSFSWECSNRVLLSFHKHPQITG